MTAFGSATQTRGADVLSLEIRSVNSRFLDLHFRLPDDLRQMESSLRERLQGRLQRGKVEVRAAIQLHAAGGHTQLNGEALKGIAEILHRVRQVLPEVPTPRLAEILAWPDVQVTTHEATDWDALVLDALDHALAQLEQARASEGQRLAEMMRERAAQMSDIVDEVEAAMPQILVEYRARQAKKLKDTLAAAFPQGLQHVSGAELSERISQETTLFSLRIDVAEEVSRLRSHLTELQQILGASQPTDARPAGAAGRGRDKAKTGSAGKRLDFLLQEMNREANTLGSKAGALPMTRAALDLKLLIEQLREQAQNIE